MGFVIGDKSGEYAFHTNYILLTISHPRLFSGLPSLASPQIRLGSNFSQACPRSSYPADGPTCISFQHRAQ